MKEITRIHIAKTPYEIELAAKQELEQYIAKLSSYAEDSEIVEDIEIRMTEILAERGVKSGGIMSTNDVKALEEQIGAPEEVAGDEAVVEPEQPDERRLYRDTDRAIVGGVISGLAAYLKINLAVARVLFIVPTVITSGVLLTVYAFMWLIVPPAKTAADRLRLRGKSVTLASIKQFSLNDDDEIAARRSQAIRRGIFGISGVLAATAAIGTLVATAVAAWVLLVDPSYNNVEPTAYRVSIAFAALAGALLSILFGLVSYMLFRRSISKKTLISSVLITILGLASFGTTVGIHFYQYAQHIDVVNRAVDMTTLELPAELKGVKRLEVDASGAIFNYTVSDELVGTRHSQPGIELNYDINEDSAKITVNYTDDYTDYDNFTPRIMLSGPELDQITVGGGSVTYSTTGQQSLQVTATEQEDGQSYGSTNFSLDKSKVDNIKLDLSKSIDFEADLSASSVKNVDLNYGQSNRVRLGNILSLSINHLQACPTNGYHAPARPSLATVRGGIATINSQQHNIKDYSSPCIDVEIYGDGLIN